MDLMNIAEGSVDLLKKNSPKILLGLGIGLGVFAVGGCGAASFKAADVIKDIHSDPYICNDKKKLLTAYAKRVIPLYIPVVLAETGSVVCLVKSYDIMDKRLLAATAFAEVSVEALNMFKKKAKEALGEEKVKELEQEVKEEQAKQDDIQREEGNSNYDVQWFHDSLTGQEFVSTITNVTRANLKFVERMSNELFMSKNEWLDILKEYTFNAHDGEYQVEQVPDGDDIGWFRGETVHVYTEKLGKTKLGGHPCIILTYSADPRPRFDRMGSKYAW